MAKDSPAPIKRRVGRPTKLTPEVQEKIVAIISQGHYRQIACDAADIPISTFDHWLTRGERRPSSIYGEFARAILRAESSAEIESLSRVWERYDDPAVVSKNAWEYLQRKFPDRWGRKDRVTYEGSDTKPIKFTLTIGRASTDNAATLTMQTPPLALMPPGNGDGDGARNGDGTE